MGESRGGPAPRNDRLVFFRRNRAPASGENFPIGSFLLPAKARPHVAAFYALARTADDVADDAALDPGEKTARLDLFERTLADGLEDGPPEALAHRRSAEETGVPLRHALDLIRAFRQDTVKRRYDSWDDLMGYCALSASPVGRFLLDLHGEDPALYRFSDPLCDALQVLNHLQDLGHDYLELDRVYLPGDWMRTQGAAVSDLGRDSASPQLRAVIDRCLDGCEELMVRARTLPLLLGSKRLAMEAAVIARLADRLIALLRAGDPLAARVAPGRADFMRCGVRGAFAGFLRSRADGAGRQAQFRSSILS